MSLTWPNGKRVAVVIAVMYETWSEGTAPTYSTQTTSLKPGTVDHAGASWASYGGRVGVWRILRTLDRLQVPGTFFANARCAELYPDSIKSILTSGHDIAGHGYTQDKLLTYMTVDEQRDTIRTSLDILSQSGATPTGWLTPVLAFTPDTGPLLAEAGLKWHADCTYSDIPHVVETGSGKLGVLPATDFSDNRVLRSNPEDFVDVYKNTFDYLTQHEPMSILPLVVHCQFGGRPMMTAMLDKILSYLKQYPEVWFARHGELADWALGQTNSEISYRQRYFAKTEL